uniref:Uncharacterized protein n=1 Tax=Arundo donax TaxID=35708 RepID=A0A0A9A722_ARUDO
MPPRIPSNTFHAAATSPHFE